MSLEINFLIYPHQLFEDLSVLKKATRLFVVEDPLFFTQYSFHAQKLQLHRMSMRAYKKYLDRNGLHVTYVECSELKHTEDIKRFLQSGVVRVYDPVDDWLESRLRSCIPEIQIIDSPNFITPRETIESFFAKKKRYFFTEFYVAQRKKYQILLENDSTPVGGKWSFDTENRKALPKNHKFPQLPEHNESAEYQDAFKYCSSYTTIGSSDVFFIPTTHQEAKQWLAQFIRERLPLFGDYEDAMSSSEVLLYHSYLTPLLNIGLLSPWDVISEAKQADVPINTKEGFIRQVLGWREYMRLVYVNKGRSQRTKNFFKFSRKIPSSFYTGTTGIVPIDTVIARLLKYGYCHHIERLMILGSFFLLCEFDPDEVYRWFMEFFVDSYDWVMVPNVYGMSQFSDGGEIVTKPFICSSNYIKKMSNYKDGPWCQIWDGLYWRFIQKHRALMQGNPRMSLMVAQLDKMDAKKKEKHLIGAEEFLRSL